MSYEAFLYEGEPTIPPGMTVREWCLAGRPSSIVDRGVLASGAEQAPDASATPPLDVDAGLAW